MVAMVEGQRHRNVDQKLHRVAINVGLSKKVIPRSGGMYILIEFYRLCWNPDD